MERTELLAHVAALYYEEDLTQTEIARQIHTSRSTVSRLLQEARKTGIVEIAVNHPCKRRRQMEQQLSERFHLREAIVLDAQHRPYGEMLRGLGVLAARYLENALAEGTILGISWGTGVHSTVQALQPERKLPITVVQMIGAAGTDDPLIDGPDLARLLANVYGGEYRFLPAPLVVEDPQIRDGLLQEPRIRETLSVARGADIALVGIGTLVPEFSSWLRAGYLDRDALAHLRAQGAVGDICAQHYDVEGHVLDIELNQRVVGVELEAMHAIKQVIGVAGGEAKVRTILGALRGRHVNVLVVDAATAQRVLTVDDEPGG